jgi:hypothetical protein
MGHSVLRAREIPTKRLSASCLKGKEVNIPLDGLGYYAATQTSSETPARAPGRNFFSI